MSVRINTDTFYIGPRHRHWLWNCKRRHPLLFAINRIQWQYFPKNQKVPLFPVHVDFEASATCNMSCPMCFRNRSDYDQELFGMMDFDTFKKGIDECAKQGVYSIRLSWRGECTTNPHLAEMINYAKKSGIKEVSFFTNGFKLKGKLAEDVVKAGVDYITISVDGMYEQYNKVRAPLTFEGIVDRLQNLRFLRDKLGKGYPRIRINSVWKESYGEKWFQNMYDFFSPIVDYMTFSPEHAFDRTKKKLRPNFTCQFPFQRMGVMWDGSIPLCIGDKKIEYRIGNVAEDSLYDLWHSRRMNKARALHMNYRASEIPCCNTCDRAVTKNVGNIKLK